MLGLEFGTVEERWVKLAIVGTAVGVVLGPTVERAEVVGAELTGIEVVGKEVVGAAVADALVVGAVVIQYQ